MGGGGGGGGGGFMGTGIGGDTGRAVGYLSGVGAPLQAISDMSGGGMWGSQGQQTVTPMGTTNADQQAMLGKYAEQMNKYAGYSRPGLENMLANSRQDVRPSSNVNPWATQQYFQNSIYNPALQQLQTQTLPSIRESMGNNYWSTARRQGEQSAQQAFANQMSNQLAGLQYQDEQARRQIADVTQARNLQEGAREQAQRINLLQLLDPILQQQFAPMTTAHTVDQMVTPAQYQPGLMDRLGQVTGMVGSLGTGAAGIAKLAKGGV